MSRTFGDYNIGLTQAVKRVARVSENVTVLDHAFDAMEDDGFDLQEVYTCLKKGFAHGPENHRSGDIRANVIHRGLKIRVSIGGLQAAEGAWTNLQKITVISVMKDE